MTLATDIAQRLRDARDHAGLSRAELSTAAGISTPAIFRLERGDGDGVRLTSIVALAEALGVSPSWLAFGEGCAAPRWVKTRDRRRSPIAK